MQMRWTADLSAARDDMWMRTALVMLGLVWAVRLPLLRGFGGAQALDVGGGVGKGEGSACGFVAADAKGRAVVIAEAGLRCTWVVGMGKGGSGESQLLQFLGLHARARRFCESESALVGIGGGIPQGLHGGVKAYDGHGEDRHANEIDFEIETRLGCGLQAGEAGGVRQIYN